MAAAPPVIKDPVPEVPPPPPMRPQAGGAPVISAEALREYLAGSGFSYLLGNLYKALGRTALVKDEARVGAQPDQQGAA